MATRHTKTEEGGLRGPNAHIRRECWCVLSAGPRSCEGLPSRLRKWAGRYLRVCALVPLFRRKMSTLFVNGGRRA